MPPYSDTWIDLFLRRRDADQTAREVAFLSRHLPAPGFPHVLDICCGLGRHAVGLARAGHIVTGVDNDPTLVREAARVGPNNPTYVHLDMRELDRMDAAPFDAALSLWASFGYFSAEDNDEVLRSVHRRLRPGGRLILDLYHRTFFETHQGTAQREVVGRGLVESKSVHDGRLVVELSYESGEADRFEWELFTPSEIAERAGACGFRVLGTWCDFDESRAADSSMRRYQVLLEAE